MATDTLLSGDLFLLQLADSALPIGGYSNSWGLETWIQQSVLRTAGDVLEAIEILLRCCAAPSDGLACSLSWLCYQGKDIEVLGHINQYLNASRWTPETLAASLSLGQRLKHLAASSGWIGSEMPDAPAHHSTIFGWLAAAQGVSREQAVSAFLYSTCAGYVSACVRLVPLGHTDGQRILTSLRTSIQKLVPECLEKTIDDMGSFALLHECASIEHESLYSRLFQS